MGQAWAQHDHLPVEPETNLDFRKVELERRTTTLVLQAFHAPAGAWQPLALSPGKDRLRIGRNPQECEIPVLGDGIAEIQAVVQRVGRNWHVVERGKTPLLEVNGFRCRQAMLAPGEACLLRFGLRHGAGSILLRLAAIHALSRDDAAPPVLCGLPQEGEYSLMESGKGWRRPFSRPTLVGADPLCDLRLPGDIAFAALIVPRGGRLHLLNLDPSGSRPARADGIVAHDPLPLHPGSALSIAGHEMILRLSRELRFAHGLGADAPVHSGCFRLLQLDSHGVPVHAHPLPPAGGAIDIGRSPERAHLAFPDHGKLSRRHAQVIAYGHSVQVLDADSLNGTCVNGERISRCLAYPGDVIALADLTFLLGYDETA